MAITLSWFNAEHTIVHYLFDGDWTWDDYYRAIEEAYQMMNTVSDQRVDAIVDMSRANSIPQNALSHLRRGTRIASENWGITVVISGNAFVRLMGNSVRKINPAFAERYYVAQSEQDALSIIEHARSSETT